jgi:hypothetical protein
LELDLSALKRIPTVLVPNEWHKITTQNEAKEVDVVRIITDKLTEREA